MANGYHQDDDKQQPQEDHDLKRIIRALEYGHANLRTHLGDLSDYLDELRDTASATLERYVANRGVSISAVEIKHIFDGLTDALLNFNYARTEIDVPLKVAEHYATQALDNFSVEDLQQMMSAGLQSNLWRRVACRRANLVLPVQQQLLLDHANFQLGHAKTAAFHLELSAAAWQVASRRLTTRMKYANENFERTLQALVVVFRRTGNVTDRAVKEVHRIFTAVQYMLATINETILVSFQQAMCAIEELRDNAADEVIFHQM